MNDYNYLGLVFNFNAKFKMAKSHYSKKDESYVFPSKKSRNVSLPLDIMLKLFSVIVKPVVLYGAEV